MFQVEINNIFFRFKFIGHVREYTQVIWVRLMVPLLYNSGKQTNNLQINNTHEQ